MQVRAALRDDLAGITGLLYGDYFRDMTELLEPAAITAFVETEFAPARLKRSVLMGGLFVAEDGPELLGFAIADREEDHVELRSICTRSTYLQLGVAKRLLDEVQDIAPDLPVSATVILGNIPAETFHESQGFVPGEVDDREVGGQHIIERRWWRSPRSVSPVS
ncbi:MAG: GNAT family N-acetyltransferase [Acidimicrobiia bacterium]|nr:GNAT family N-acetyltransferase [Acidimicrobiia bacterium]MDH3470748.1 GNAT family N-acetyltransferase [Acidimicrobiia bacterium]